MTVRDRREYHKSLRASPGYQERERAKKHARMLDPVYAEKERTRERLRVNEALDAQAAEETHYL